MLKLDFESLRFDMFAGVIFSLNEPY